MKEQFDFDRKAKQNVMQAANFLARMNKHAQKLMKLKLDDMSRKTTAEREAAWIAECEATCDTIEKFGLS